MDEMRRFVGIDVAKVALDVFIGSVGRGILRTRYSRSPPRMMRLSPHRLQATANASKPSTNSRGSSGEEPHGATRPTVMNVRPQRLCCPTLASGLKLVTSDNRRFCGPAIGDVLRDLFSVAACPPALGRVDGSS